MKNINQEFLKAVSNSFKIFLEIGTSRSTAKLKPLHGTIARHIAEKLGSGYLVHAQGYGKGKEIAMSGRYIDKKVDIAITKDNMPVAGIGVKFVMQNYSQNSVNYFENMLGETANLRTNRLPYFQIFIILDCLPYYNSDKIIKKWETLTTHNVEKYIRLSNDNVEAFYHSPNKTLVYVVHIPENNTLSSQEDYLNYYRKLPFNMTLSSNAYDDFGNTVILNNYQDFIDKVYYTIKAM